MLWEGRRESENVEDRRGMQTGVVVGGGGLIIAVIAMFLGVDPRQLANIVGQPGQQQQAAGPTDPAEERLAHFTRTILADTEDVWDELFRQAGRTYRKPTLVMFRGRVDSACGFASAAVGPFYCPGDHRVYIDLAFYRDMQRKLNAPGEFARAYVIAHEVGHHVQNLLGDSARADEARQRGSKTEANNASVRLELQADYLAGVWAHYGQKKFRFLEPGDIDSALNAAFQIGDDRLQNQARGYVVPDSFTHGTSKQRQKWFYEGYETGDVNRRRKLFDLPYGEL